jgi:hypothetical protein
MSDNRLPGWFKNKPSDDGDGGEKLNDQLAAAAAVTIAERSEACALHIRHAARLYLGALRAMGEATLRFEELKGFGLDDLGFAPFGPVDGLAISYRDLAVSLVRAGYLAADDPLVEGIDLDDPPADLGTAG